MKIGELAKATGLTPSRIRFYEAEGLISIPPRGSNGYRMYSADTAGVLKIIDSAQRAGFTLEQIRRFLPSGKEKWDHEDLVQTLNARVVEIQHLILQLQESEARLQGIIEGVSQRPEGISCADNRDRLMGLLDGALSPQATAVAASAKSALRAKSKGASAK